MRAKHIALLSTLALLIALPATAEISSTERNIMDHLKGAAMMKTVRDLCVPQFAGRRAGSEGDRLAAEYLIKQFRDLGLQEVPGTQNYAQGLTLRYSLVDDVNDISAKLTLPFAKTPKSYTFAYPYYYGTGGIDKKAPIAFVGYGVCMPEQSYDDYSGIDAHGKILLMLSGGPKGIKGVSDARKMITAYEHGAIGCLIIGNAGKSVDWDEANYGLASPMADFPSMVIDRTMASGILTDSGLKLDALDAGLRAGKRVSQVLKTEATLRVPKITDPARPTRNLMAILPGSDPKLKDEYIIVSGHHDHLGTSYGHTYHGADDNASGTATTLEIARAMLANPERPKRSILFIHFGAEEGGLTGSNYFIEHPPVPLERIKAVLQMDMVGIGDQKQFITTGGQSFPETYQVVKDAASELGYSISKDVFLGASDNLPFARKRIPGFMFTTAGEHPHYHMDSDLPDTLSPVLLEDTAKLVALTAWRLANQ